MSDERQQAKVNDAPWFVPGEGDSPIKVSSSHSQVKSKNSIKYLYSGLEYESLGMWQGGQVVQRKKTHPTPETLGVTSKS